MKASSKVITLDRPASAAENDLVNLCNHGISTDAKVAAIRAHVVKAIPTKSKADIQARITQVEDSYSHVLNGSCATVVINAPRALQQIAAESELKALYWSIGKTFKTKLKGVDT